MSYFHLDPWLCSWRTDHLLRIVDAGPDPDFIDYKPEHLKAAVLGAYDRAIADGSHFLQAVKDYRRALEQVQPVDFAVVISDDTIAAKPNKDGRTTYRQLPLDHPANTLAREVNSRLYQLQERTGRTAYIVQATLPFVPGVAVPGPRRPEVHPALREYWRPHGFSKWDNPEAQAEKFKWEVDRAQKYRQPAAVPDWNPEDAPLLVKATEAIIMEKTARFIADKTTDRFWCIAPNSPTKSAIKRGIIEAVKKLKPGLIKKEHLIDVVGSLSEDGRTQAFDERYRTGGYICSPAVLGEFTKRLGNACGFSYSEPYSVRGAEVREDTERTRRALDRILNRHPNAQQIRNKIDELKIRIPTIQGILRGINFDLWQELQPLPLSGEDIPREKCDISASEIAGAFDAVEFFLKREGCLPMNPELQLLADVGTVCHQTVYDTAPDSWQEAMERPGVLRWQTSRDEIPLDITVHCQPDLVAWHSGDIGTLVLDNKTSATMRYRNQLRLRERRQLAVYSLFAQEAAKRRGLENAQVGSGAIVHFRDLQWEDWWITKWRISGEDYETTKFKAREMVWFRKRWKGQLPPEAYGPAGFLGEPRQFLADLKEGEWDAKYNRAHARALKTGDSWTVRRIAAIESGKDNYCAKFGV